MNEMALRQNQPPATRDEMIKVLSSSHYPGATPESVGMVVAYCSALSVDPLMKPVHIVPMWDKKANSMRDVVMPGIALYRIMASRAGTHCGTSEPEFGPTIEDRLGDKPVRYPEWCRVRVKTLVGGQVVEFVGMEYWLENYATAGRNTDAPNSMWAKRPFAQLAKCAEAQALRRAFPELLGGQMTAEEMEGKVIDLDASPESLPAQGTGRAQDRLSSFAGQDKARTKAAPATGDDRAEDQPALIDDHIPDFDKPAETKASKQASGNDGDLPGRVPTMPEDTLRDWQENGKWLAAYRWIAMQVDALSQKPARELVMQHKDILIAVAGHNHSYRKAVNDMGDKVGIRIG